MPDSKPPTVEEITSVIQQAVSMTCPRYLAHLKDDIAQEAYVRLMRAASLDDPRFRVRSYLWKAAHCAILDAMRTMRRRSAESLTDGSDLDLSRPSNDPNPDSRARSKEVAAAIRDCLGTLNEARRRVVTLSLLGYGLTEIATILAEERKRIDNLLYRGMASLRECLMGKGVTP